MRSLCALLALALVACGGGGGGGAGGGGGGNGSNPTGPSPSGGGIAFRLSADAGTQPVMVAFTFMNQTFATSSGAPCDVGGMAGARCWSFSNVSPGEYEVAGTLMSDQANFGFSRISGSYPCPSNPGSPTCGGVDPTSLQVLEGPHPQLKQCPPVAHFDVLGPPRLPLPQTFRFRFTVRGSFEPIC